MLRMFTEEIIGKYRVIVSIYYYLFYQSLRGILLCFLTFLPAKDFFLLFFSCFFPDPM